MPVADQLVDAAAKHQILSFMDGHSGYNQIYIAEKDVPKTAILVSRRYWDFWVGGYAIWIEECGGNLSESNELDLS